MIFRIILVFFFYASSATALIGGQEVSPAHSLSRSVVALQMVEKESSGRVNLYKGSGVLISRRVVLTAGHNFFYLPDPTLSAAIFSTRPDWGLAMNREKRISIKKAVVLPDFSQGPLGTQNDLALLLLDEAAPPSYQPIEIQVNGKFPPQFHEVALTLGYGKSVNDPHTPLSDFRLRQLTLPFARWEKNNILDSSKIWLNHQNGSIAGGDSGGPLIFYRRGTPVVYGITIHPRYDECVKLGTCESQAAFTNLTFFANWIQSTLGALEAEP